MLTWEDLNLKDDPFTITPAEAIWADRSDFKHKLTNAFRRALLSTPSRIIACIWGDWGAGKTHAMRYFTRPEVIKNIIKEMEVPVSRPPFSIQIIFPLENILNSIYLEIVEKVGVDLIIRALNELESKFQSIRPKEDYIREVSKYVDPRIAEAFVTLKGRKLLVFKRYLSLTATSTELRNAGIARGIITSTDKVRTVSGIFNLLTATVASRIFLWFDDLERIGDRPGKEIFDFQYFIRDLLDYVPTNLVIIFNMTMLPGENVEDRLFLLGDAIISRISDIIRVDPLTKDDYFSYVRDLLSHYRLKPEKERNKFFPFEKSALDFIYSELKKREIPLTPREVNHVLSSSLSVAINEKEKTDPLITREFIESHIDYILKVIKRKA